MKNLIYSIMAILAFAACSGNEPPFTPEEEGAMKNGTDVEYVKPILYETENLDWFTEYNVVKNIYTTKMTHGTVFYKIKDDFVLADDIMITKIVKEEDGKFELIDVSESQQENLRQYKTESLDIKVYETGNVDISVTPIDYLYSYEYRYYHIYLSNSNKTIGTKIIINDIYDWSVSGIAPVNFDLSGIKYPNKRHYDERSGNYKGYEYSIWLPGDECELELPTTAYCYINSVSLFSLLNSEEEILYQFKYNYDLPQTDELNQQLREVLTEHGEFRYIKIGEKEFALKCKIFENQSGQERKISIFMGGPAHSAILNFIQAAK